MRLIVNPTSRWGLSILRIKGVVPMDSRKALGKDRVAVGKTIENKAERKTE